MTGRPTEISPNASNDGVVVDPAGRAAARAAHGTFRAHACDVVVPGNADEGVPVRERENINVPHLHPDERSRALSRRVHQLG